MWGYITPIQHSLLCNESTIKVLFLLNIGRHSTELHTFVLISPHRINEFEISNLTHN